MKFFQFKKNEDGAVTIDFVVLLAGIVLLAVAITLALRGQVTTLNDSIVKELAKVKVAE